MQSTPESMQCPECEREQIYPKTGHQHICKKNTEKNIWQERLRKYFNSELKIVGGHWIESMIRIVENIEQEAFDKGYKKGKEEVIK